MLARNRKTHIRILIEVTIFTINSLVLYSIKQYYKMFISINKIKISRNESIVSIIFYILGLGISVFFCAHILKFLVYLYKTVNIGFGKSFLVFPRRWLSENMKKSFSQPNIMQNIVWLAIMAIK